MSRLFSHPTCNRSIAARPVPSMPQSARPQGKPCCRANKRASAVTQIKGASISTDVPSENPPTSEGAKSALVPIPPWKGLSLAKQSIKTRKSKPRNNPSATEYATLSRTLKRLVRKAIQSRRALDALLEFSLRHTLGGYMPPAVGLSIAAQALVLDKSFARQGK